MAPQKRNRKSKMASFKCSQNTKSTTLRPRCQLCRKKRSPRSYLSNSGNCTSCENLCRKCGREIEQCECPPKGTDGRKQNVLKKQSQCLPRDHVFIQRLQVEMHQRNKNYIILQNIITTKECLEIRKWIQNSRSKNIDIGFTKGDLR